MKALYLGLEMPAHLLKDNLVHCPLIQIHPLPKTDEGIASAMAAFADYTHILFTSKSAVSIFFNYCPEFGIEKDQLKEKKIVAVGKKTAEKISQFGLFNTLIASEETAEGVISALDSCNLSHAHFFWPHSALSRPLIAQWFLQQQIPLSSCIFYDTVMRMPDPLPNLDQFDEIIFTSPSTVDAFFQVFGSMPTNKILKAIGPITQHHLAKFVENPQNTIHLITVP